MKFTKLAISRFTTLSLGGKSQLIFCIKLYKQSPLKRSNRHLKVSRKKFLKKKKSKLYYQYWTPNFQSPMLSCHYWWVIKMSQVTVAVRGFSCRPTLSINKNIKFSTRMKDAPPLHLNYSLHLFSNQFGSKILGCRLECPPLLTPL